MNEFDKERKSNETRIDLTIRTKVPSKWRLIDLETGEIYKYGPSDRGQFTRLDFDEAMIEFGVYLGIYG